MKKFISLLLVFAMCLSLFSACVATPEPSPSLSPEELEQLEVQKYCDKWNDIKANGKNYRAYFFYQDIKNQLFYVGTIIDVNKDKIRYFTYSGGHQTYGFGDTVDEKGERCFSSVQAILDMGLFSVKVEDSFVEPSAFDSSRYSYTWWSDVDFLSQSIELDYFIEYRDIVEFSDSHLIDKDKKELNESGRIFYNILTQIGKVPDFDTSEVGYVITGNPKSFKENIEKVTIIPDPNLK